MGLRMFLLTVAVVFWRTAWVTEGCSGSSGSGCSPSDCTVSDWSGWSSCSTTCGKSGVKKRTRTITNKEACGGKPCTDFSLSDTTSCPNNCCPVDCQFSWNSWSPCPVTCGNGTQVRTMKILSLKQCGGKDCPRSVETKQCGDGRCCPVNCQVASWGSWGSCNAACEKTGVRTRTRRVTTSPTCGGTSCPSTTDTLRCSGPCCPRNCVLSSWSAWNKCASRSCAQNSGTQVRTRRIKTVASCGGSCSSSLRQTQRCTPIPISCVVSSWGSWQSCTPSNGNCGAGTQKRVRTIIRPSYCSPSCPSTQESRSCVHSCCPVNCQMNNWGAWTACSSTCGRGTITRKRTVKVPASCGGQACPSLTQSNLCVKYNDKDCVMSNWGSWSICDNGCGQGRARKTRRIISKQLCRGQRCGVTEAFKLCTDYRENRNCQVGQWSSWGRCDQACTVGSKQRTRVVTVSQRCRGNKCPALKESTQCGSANNGCQHKCTNGVCSCNPGYNLVRSKLCVAKDCGKLSLTYCAPGTQNGTTCLHASVSCPNANTTFPVTCSIVCPSTYAVKGVTSVSCTTAGTWSSTARTYCRRINDPPTQIVLSGPHRVSENLPRNTLVGVLSSSDPNAGDSHSYSLVTGGEGKFVVRGDKLYTTDVLNYETMSQRYDLTIRSTDSGNPPFKLDKTFTILLSDVNEPPTNIQLSNTNIDENSDVDTVVGLLSTTDEDRGQTYSYLILDTAAGRFKIDGNNVKVATSNNRCLQYGGNFCALNHEKNNDFTIVVQSTDSGSPALSTNVTLNITVTDVNDQPRGLGLTGNTVMENATSGHVIGHFFAQDEDQGQKLKYSLTDDDQGRFGVRPDGTLYKVQSTDYEKNKTHLITAVVEDNGRPRKKMERTFVIEVLDVNEPPINIHLKDSNGQLKFPSDHARINENTNVGKVVGTLEATDNDASQKLTFNLDSDASGAFSLSGVNCSVIGTTKTSVCIADLLVSGDINYETSSKLDVLVRVTDQHGLFKIKHFNISVVDVNERPSNVTISGSLVANVLENSVGAFVGELVTTDEDNGQNHTYALLSDDVFEIRGNKIYFKSTVSLDFEKKNKYVVMATSTDDGEPKLTSAPQRFSIHVLDRNEAPNGITLSKSDISENRPSGTIVGNLAVDDPDNSGNYSSRQHHVCLLSNSAQGKFGIVLRNKQNLLYQAVASLDYEKSRSLNISVVCSDPNGLSFQKSFVVTVKDVNEVPTKVTLSKTRISENMPPSVVGVLSTQDPDNLNNPTKQSFLYSISNTSVGSSPFAINGSILKTTRSLNYETARSWTVVVRAQDNGNPPLYRDETILIHVDDMNDRPAAIQVSNVQVNENSGIGTLVGKLATSDEDSGQNHTYQMVDSAGGRFKIDGDSVLVALPNALCLQYGGSACALNYEDQASYNITIRTTDDGNPMSSFVQTFVIFLVDVNDQPRDIRLSNNEVKENASTGAVIGSFSARDEDLRQVLSFSLTDDDGGRFAVNSKGELVTAKELNHEAANNHVIRVQVRDNGYDAMEFESNFTIEVLNVNEAPIAVQFWGNLVPKVLENTTTGTIVGKLLAQDSDANQTLHFRLDDDSDGVFSLTQSQCQSSAKGSIKTSCTMPLRLVKPLNYETANLLYITVRVTDNNGLFKVQRLPINITDCNDAPTNLTLNGGLSAVVSENAKGVLVGEFQTSDEDSSQSWRYELLDNAGGLFRILGSKIYVSGNSTLDYEKESTHIVTVRSTDSGVPPYSITRSFTIFVSDLNEQPKEIILSSNDIEENSSPGTFIANITVEDPDNAAFLRQHHSCAVIGRSRDKFSVNSLVLVSTVKLDYERTAVINITIQCADNGVPSLKYQKDFSIVVLDVNEAPTNILLSNLNVRENLLAGSIGTLSTIDPDNSMGIRQKFTYEILPGDSRKLPFQIDGDNLNTTQKLDYEKESFWNITIRSTDNGNGSISVEVKFIINVLDVNEAPTGISLSPNTINENTNENILVGILKTEDEDLGQSHRYTLLDGAAGRFMLVNNTEVRVAISNTDCLLHGGKHCMLNYEAQSEYSIRVRSTDDGFPPLYYDVDLYVTLDDVNDQPRNLSLSNYWVKENATVNTTIGYFTAHDEDSNTTLRFSLAKNVHFDVSEDGRLFVVKSTDHEKRSSVVITVKVTDNGDPPKWMEKQFTIIIQNVNEAPINTTFTSTDGQESFADNQPTIGENSPIGTVVGTLVSLDQDAGQHLIFTLDESSGGRFSVNTLFCRNVSDILGIKTSCSCKLSVNGALNYEDIPEHDIIVRVTDNYGHFHVSKFTIKVLDRNDQPSNVTIQSSFFGQVKENRNGEMVGELVTSDEDLSQSHSYTLKNSSNSRFTLRGSRLYTSRTANLDYEKQQELEIIVVSTDDGSPPKSVEQRLTIQVQDVNESPTNISLSGIVVIENSQKGTFVANITVIDPDNLGPKGIWQTHSCQLLDSAQERFMISTASNILLVNTGELNYERAKAHQIKIQCRDSAQRPLAVTKSFLINVTDVNEAPVQITLSNNEVPENSGPVYVGNLATIDPDNELFQRQTFTYSFIEGNDEGMFFISRSNLKTSRSLDYEKKSSWELLIETKDSGGLTFSQNFTITVKDTNDRPTDIVASQPLKVFENSALGTPIAVFSAVDEDAGQTHRFYIIHVSVYGYGFNSSGNHLSSFLTLDPSSGRLLVTSPIDFETYTRVALEIMTHDSGYPSFFFNKTFVLDILDVNEPPDGINLDHAKIPENSQEGSVVGNLSVSDPDNANGDLQHYDCKVVNDVPFKVLELKLIVGQSVLDFEKKAYYKVEVNCSQQGNATFHISRTFGISITDVNERPFNLSITNSFVEENRATAKSLVATITAEDPDNDNIVFTLAQVGDDFTAFYVNETSLFTLEVFDYEIKSSYFITLVASDDGDPSLNATKQFNIKVRDMNDRPQKINFFSFGVNEKATEGTVIGNFTTIDQDEGQSHVYQLLDYKEIFYINGNQLVLNQSGILNYENRSSINISVQTTDNGSPRKAYTELLTVVVLDGNDRPYHINVSHPIYVDENTQGNTAVVFHVLDEDKSQKHSCSIINKGFFEINNTNGRSVLRVRDGVVVDYERNRSFEISLHCFDDGPAFLTIDKNFTINIRDVNERPTKVLLNGPGHILENVSPSGNGSVVGALSCEDPDQNQTHSFKVLGEYKDTFNITNSNGAMMLTVVSNEKLDYEKLDSPNISIEIMATDDGDPPLSLVWNVSLTITEVNEEANKIVLSSPNVTLNETQPPGTNISELLCNNPEKWQRVNYTLFSHQDLFMIKTIDYNITFEPPILNKDGVKQSRFPQTKSFLFIQSHLPSVPNANDTNDYAILVQVTDNGEPALSFNDTVKVYVEKVDPCVPENDCHWYANCSRVNGTAYNCSCNDGFTGDGYNCTEIDDCLESTKWCDNNTINETCSPCKNNATCYDAHLTFNCSCKPGFNGSQCAHNINECRLPLPHRCSPHSRCHDAINNFTCTCYRGFDGWLCDNNIDDCVNENCSEHGECVDGVDTFTCDCSDGFQDTRCHRPVVRACDRCMPGQYCVPYRLNETNESEQRVKKENSNTREICFSGKNITTIYLAKQLITKLANASTPLDNVTGAIKMTLEDWFLKYIRVYYKYTDFFTKYTDLFFNLSDVSVLNITENLDNISISLIARVRHEALSEEGFVCSLAYLLNQTSHPSSCLLSNLSTNFTSKEFRYTDYLCPMIDESHHFDCIDPRKVAGLASAKKHSLLPGWSIYLLAATAVALFLFFLFFAVHGDRSHRFNMQEAMRRREQYDHVRLPEEDDEHYRDVMFRHHISTAMAQTGAVNPMYGLDEEDDQTGMIDNPLYGTIPRDESLSADNRAFVNPLYESLRREPGLRAKAVTKDDINY